MSLSPIAGSSGTQPTAGPQRPQHHGPPKAAMDAAATALGMASDEMRTALKSGSTLGDLAKAKGVSTDDLTKAMVTALKANKPADAPELTDERLMQIVGNMIAGKRPQGPPPENPVAAEFVRQARDRELSSGDYGAGRSRSGSLVDVSA